MVLLPLLSYCLSKMFIQLVKDATYGEDKLSLKYYWRNSNNEKVMDIIGSVWADVMQSCVNGV